jgi:hypothetical protein
LEANLDYIVRPCPEREEGREGAREGRRKEGQLHGKNRNI